MTHDNVTDIVERIAPLLEELETGQDCAEYAYAKGKGFQAMTYCPEAFEALKELPEYITTLRKQLENAREALQKIAHLDVPRPVAVQYMPDRPSKHDKCAHDVWMYDECGNCISDFATEALKGQPC